MPADRVSRRWRKYLRFRVRGLLVLVLVIGLGLGGMILWVRSARVQRVAAAEILKAGGSVTYVRGFLANPFAAQNSWAPRWLGEWIGQDYFDPVTVVGLNQVSKANTAVVLVCVGRLTQLERLQLDGLSVGDAGLVHLEPLTGLSYLDLSGTQISDAGLVHIESLTKLSILYLGRTRVTDAGLIHLKGLTRLSELHLDGTQVSDAGLAQLQGLSDSNG